MYTRISNHNVINGHAKFARDAIFLPQGNSTDTEKLMEFGARVCYRSTSKMGDSKNLVQSCMQQEHYDIAEHGHIVIRISDLPDTWQKEKYLNCFVINNELFVSGNVRAWYDVCHRLSSYRPAMTMRLHEQLSRVSPSIFPPTSEKLFFSDYDESAYATNVVECPTLGQHSQLIGHDKNIYVDKSMALTLNYATFYVDGVSRALTHQLVRSRKQSYSQASQRYIDRNKGEWKFVCPPSITNNAEALNIWKNTIEVMGKAYDDLRKMGIYKEDARYVLPNACETAVVVSGHFSDWMFFLKQREAKDAQWEIRDLANEVRMQLHQIAPHVF